MKKLAGLLCFFLVMAFSVGVLGETEGDWAYNASSGHATLTGYMGSEKNLIFPSTLGGNTVTTMDDIFDINNRNDIVSVILPDSYTSIGYGTFYNCSNLESIVIPSSVVEIYPEAFSNCTSLVSIIVPDLVTQIQWRTFYGCTTLKSITFPDSLTTIDSEAFHNCSSLVSITIPNNVKSIGEDAFRNCSSLISISIPSSVTEIGYEAFLTGTNHTSIYWLEPNPAFQVDGDLYYFHGTLYCFYDSEGTKRASYFHDFIDPRYPKISMYYQENEYSETELFVRKADQAVIEAVIPEGVTAINARAFSGCTDLTDITLPSTLTTIESSAFESCYSLSSITIPDGLTYVAASAFDNCPAVLICNADSEGAKTLSKAGFAFTDPRCSELKLRYTFENGQISGLVVVDADPEITSVSIPGFVTAIGESAFAGNAKLEIVHLPEGLNTIGEKAFSNCKKLRSISIPNSVAAIAPYAFSNCSKLRTIELPGSVETIGTRAFQYCTALNGVILQEGLRTIEDHAFRGCSSLGRINFPASVTSIGDYAFHYYGAEKSSFYVPDTVNYIGDHAFHTDPERTTLYCYQHSYAESWANHNGVPCVLLDGRSFLELGGTVSLPESLVAANDRETRIAPQIFPFTADLDISWSSSDPEVAEITTEGVLIPKANGSTTIILRADEVTASMAVTVVTPARTLELPEDLYMQVGRGLELPMPDVSPADATLSLLWRARTPSSLRSRVKTAFRAMSSAKRSSSSLTA